MRPVNGYLKGYRVPVNGHDFSSALRKLGIPLFQSGFEDNLTDESRFRGHAEGLIRARDPGHVVAALNLATLSGVRLTVVSGKTSLTGSSVPLGGTILDVRGLDAFATSDPMTVQPGVITKRYRDYADRLGFFFPPDPTSENSCTIGGNVACNASGALSYLYGPTRNYVRGLTVALPTGSVLRIDRGQVFSVQGRIIIPRHFLTPQPPSELIIPAPRYAGPRWERCKSAAGLYGDDPMDLVDLFVGSEGILGVVLEVRTILLPRRKPYVALLLYVPSRDVTVDLVLLLDALKRWSVHKDGTMNQRGQGRLKRGERLQDGEARGGVEAAFQALTGGRVRLVPENYDAVVPSCMEWMGASVAPLLADSRARRLRASYGCLYVEQEYQPDQDPLTVISQWADLVDVVNRLRTAAPGRIHTEVALDQNHIRQMREERRSVPERLNQLIQPGRVKIGMDFAVPRERLGWLMELYDRSLPARASYVFGHIGNAHLHVNLVPETAEEEQSYREVYRSIALRVCEVGGTVSGEHGIGKIKREALEAMLGPEGVAEIVRIKKILDPAGILNMGNMVRME